MLTPEQRGQFEKEGYLRVPNVLTPEQVEQLRSFFRPKFNLPPEQRFPGDKPEWLFNIWGRFPEVRWLLFHEPTVRILKSLLGDDYVMMPECSAALNSFRGVWHKDTTEPERRGHRFHWEKDFLIVSMAYYLQDNTPEWGGGLDVEPGSHLQPDRFPESKNPALEWERRPLGEKIAFKMKKALYGLAGRKVRVATPSPEPYAPKNPVSIPNKAGDVVLFHFRMNHSATLPRQLPVPPGREKITIFDSRSRNNRHVRSYLDYVHTNPEYKYLQHTTYPAELLQQARAAGIRFALEDYRPPA